MALRLSIMGMVLSLGTLAGCAGPQGTDKADTGTDAQDDTGGGGSHDVWRPSGEGSAYFLDGAADNSLFHLELTRCSEPPDGEAYYGWVSKAGEDPISVGEITVSGEDVYFEYDIGVNAIIQGYDTFEAWATDNGGSAREGTELWAGQVNPEVYDVIQNLLISSDATPDGQGSLRAVESAIEDIRVDAQELADATYDAPSFSDSAESISNAIAGTSEDLNDDGTASVLDGQFGVLQDGGYVDLILADIAAASSAVTPTNPIKDLANDANDCTEQIRVHAQDAAESADFASVCAGEETCMLQIQSVLEDLGYTLDGEDVNGDGVIDDLANPPEGTIECAITFVSQMAQMDVAVP